MTDRLRDALNDVATKSTWRPDNTVLIHDGTAWNTLVGRIVMATTAEPERIRAAINDLDWEGCGGHGCNEAMADLHVAVLDVCAGETATRGRNER